MLTGLFHNFDRQRHGLVDKKANGHFTIIPVSNFQWISRLVELEGKWIVNDICLKSYYMPGEKNVLESILLLGTRKWTTFIFRLFILFLSDSAKTDEGGIIIYFRYKNKKNHYSFHFCVSKNKIELWKRFRGAWSLVGSPVDYTFQVNHPYQLEIISQGAEHTCIIDGKKIRQYIDGDLPQGMLGFGTKLCSAEYRNIEVRKK